MKRLKKADIIKLRQVDHCISENTILADIDHPFLVRFLLLKVFVIANLVSIRLVCKVSRKIAATYTSSCNTLLVVSSSLT